MSGVDDKLRWLDGARELTRRLVSVSVRRANGQDRRERGVSPSTLGDVVAFLGHHRDLEAFDRFLGLYPDLDRAWAQNQRNQKAERDALAGVLRDERRRTPERNADAWLLVLAWARQMMAVEVPTRSPDRRRSSGRGEAGRRPNPADRRDRPGKHLGSMAGAWEKAKSRRDRDGS